MFRMVCERHGIDVETDPEASKRQPDDLKGDREGEAHRSTAETSSNELQVDDNKTTSQAELVANCVTEGGLNDHRDNDGNPGRLSTQEECLLSTEEAVPRDGHLDQGEEASEMIARSVTPEAPATPEDLEPGTPEDSHQLHAEIQNEMQTKAAQLLFTPPRIN